LLLFATLLQKFLYSSLICKCFQYQLSINWRINYYSDKNYFNLFPLLTVIMSAATKPAVDWADVDDESAPVKKLPPLPGNVPAAEAVPVPPAAPVAAAATAEKKEKVEEPAAPASAVPATDLATKAAAEISAAEKEEKEKTDVLVLGSMLSQLGGVEPEAVAVAAADSSAAVGDAAAAEEQLHLLKPFESHMSEQMFTDDCFKM
jgi:hypothetical protein